MVLMKVDVEMLIGIVLIDLLMVFNFDVLSCIYLGDFNGLIV